MDPLSSGPLYNIPFTQLSKKSSKNLSYNSVSHAHELTEEHKVNIVGGGEPVGQSGVESGGLSCCALVSCLSGFRLDTQLGMCKVAGAVVRSWPVFILSYYSYVPTDVLPCQSSNNYIIDNILWQNVFFSRYDKRRQSSR